MSTNHCLLIEGPDPKVHSSLLFSLLMTVGDHCLVSREAVPVQASLQLKRRNSTDRPPHGNLSTCGVIFTATTVEEHRFRMTC